MFDIGWSELLIIGLVALIVVGPKDLPVMFRKIGQWVGRMRNMARDFQRAMDDAADQAGINELKEGIKDATNIQDKVFGDAAESLKSFQKEVEGEREVKKVDAAAEHARRQKMKEEANKAAENWDHEKKQDVPSETPDSDQTTSVASKSEKQTDTPKRAVQAERPTKSGAKKTPVKKTAAKKAAAKKTTKKAAS